MTLRTFPATCFDGRSAAPHPAELAIDGGELALRMLPPHGDATPGPQDGDSRLAREPVSPPSWTSLSAVEVSPRLAHAPRTVRLPDGRSIEVGGDADAFDTMLRAGGIVRGPAQRLEAHGATLAALVVLLAAGLVWGYLVGLPWVARIIAERTPADVEASIGDEFLKGADHAGYFKPSAVPAERRASLEAQFAELAARASPDTPYRIEFRAQKGLEGVNALTLPGGTILFLDGLTHDATDAALLGVFAHELGHVSARHTLRQLIQASGVGIVATLVWGDFSAVAANAAFALSTLSYSRAFEEEADAFAVHAMAITGHSIEPTIELLLMLGQRHHGEDGPGLLSTHPPTPGRTARMRELMRAEGGPRAKGP